MALVSENGPGGRTPGTPVMRSATIKRAAPSPSQPPSDPMATAVPFQQPLLNGIMPPGPTDQGGGGIVPPMGGIIPQPAVGREAIDPNQRGTRLTFNPQVGQIGSVGPLDPYRDVGTDPGINPADFAAGGQYGTNTDILQRAGSGFTVSPQSVLQQAMSTFQSQLPLLNDNLDLATQGLAKRTSALGRTGSGLFNRDTNQLSDRARAERESLLGNLAFQAAGQDAANKLQADIATGGFQQQGLSRLLQGSQFGQQNALQAALENARLTQSGQAANQGADLTARGQDLQRMIANQGAEGQNINNALQVALQQLGLGQQQQGREDNLAREAQNNLFQQLQLLGSGFGGDPTAALNALANAQAGSGQEYGANAAQTNAGLAGLGQSVAGLVGDAFARRNQGG